MHKGDPVGCIERLFITVRCEDSRGVVQEVDPTNSVNPDAQDAETWTALVVAVQFLPRIFDSLPSFLRTLPVLRRSLQPLHPRQSAEQAPSDERRIHAPLYASTCSARFCRRCILRSTCASCQRGRLRGPGRTPCRPLVSGVRGEGFGGVEGGHTEPVGLLGVHL